MSEADWGSDVTELAAPPRKRIPGWVWGCGAGCGLFAIVAVLALVFVFRFVGKALDQDTQWESLGQHVVVTEPPPGVHIFGMPFRIEGIAMWVITDQAQGTQGMFMQASAGTEAAQTRGELLDPEGDMQIGGPFGGYGRNEVESGTVEVQGRTLPCLRYQSFPKGDAQEAGPFDAFKAQLEGASIVVDLTPEGSEDLLMLVLTKQRTRKRVSDEELRAFLAPFRIPGGTGPDAPEPPPVEEPVEEDR
jgi:hypothetical protein